MTLAVTERHGEGDIIARQTAVHISCTDLPTNDDTAFDEDIYPASPAIVYYFSAEKTGVDSLVSQVFSPNGGHGYWEGVIFPDDGDWDIHVRKVEDDSSVVDTTVTVEAP